MEKPVFVLCGPAGSGKTTVQHYLMDHFHLAKVVTHTTRPPRAGEVNGRDYYFENPASFARLHLLEKVEYDHHAYGSSREGLDRALAGHPGAVIVLDTAGAVTYCNQLNTQVVVLYLTVASPAQLKERLEQRGDTPAAMASRLAIAEFQRDLRLPAALAGRATVIENDDWKQTTATLDQLVAAALMTRKEETDDQQR